MTDRSDVRERFLRDPLPVRLGGLAANLARAQSFSANPMHGAVVLQVLGESAWFIEWAAPGAALETQVTLLDCQRQLARWRLSWADLWADPNRRAEVAEQTGAWSKKLLNLSGLVQAASRGAASHRA